MTPASGFRFREAVGADLPGIGRVRTSVRENLLTREQLDQRGITNEAVAASFLLDSKGWVAERDGEIVAFSIADRATCSIFALFVLPDCEAQGVGSRLLACAVQWLWDNGAECIWLTTGPSTRAAEFYARQGWQNTGLAPNGELRFELRKAGRSPPLLR